MTSETLDASAADALFAAHTARWRRLDPLLPDAAPLTEPGPGESVLTVGRAAAALARTERVDIDSLAACWSALQVYRLTARIAGSDPEVELDTLLTRWRETLPADPGPTASPTDGPADGPARRPAEGSAGGPAAGRAGDPGAGPAGGPPDGSVGGPAGAAAADGAGAGLQWGPAWGGAGGAGGSEADSEAVVTWPSRDVAVARALVRHGLAPLTVIAARPAGRPVPADPRPVRVRRAGAQDLDAVVELRLATIRYDAHFGSVRERPSTAAQLRALTEQVFARSDPWTWVAVRDGAVVGMVTVDQPPHADWIAGMTSARPVGYIDCLGVSPGSRGSGVGTALLAQAHRALDDAGVAVTLLHHGLPNPLSTPTYGRHGYRPLWTIWEARPATALR